MAEDKSFWKRFEFLIIAIATLLFIYLLLFFNQKANFLLGNELIIYLTPNEKSFVMHYGNVSRLEIDTGIENFAYCRASCSYEFNDRSRNEVIDKGIFEIKPGNHFTKEYNLSVKRLGSGQDLYSFDVSCQSIRSLLCLTKGIGKSRSSLVTVNYDLTETEKKLKDSLKQNVTMLLLLLADTDIMQQKISQKYFELGFRANLKNLSKDKIETDDSYDKFAVSAENLRSLWSVENYNKLSQLFNRSFFEELADIEKSIIRLDNGINSIAEAHNLLLSALDAIGKNLQAVESFSAFSGSETIDETGFNAASSALTNNTFENYSTMSSQVEGVKIQQDLLVSSTRLSSARLFFSAEYFLKRDSDFLCSLVQSCRENISIYGIAKKTEIFLEDYPNELLLKETCSSLNELNNDYIAAKNETLKLIQNKSTEFPGDNEFMALAESFKDNEIRKINNSYHESLEKLKSGNKTSQDAIKISEDVLPKNKTDVVQLNYNESLNLSLYLLSKAMPSEETKALLEKCSGLGKIPSKIGKFNFEPVSLDINYTIVPRIDTNLSDNFPVCCVFNDCRPCCRSNSCRNDPKTFPAIFLHGHSLASGNSPEFSLDAFNKLQSRLQDDGYLNAGIISLYSQNEPLQKGVWGLSGKPVTVKASYYYDAFRKEDKYIVVPTKSENIDTYALRLRELIELTKERTDKPKVNIIAHSMGGLVARRYIQIFGEDSVDKLILIATPNKGVSGTAGNYCGFIGEGRECRDMLENSLFLNKLNDPLKQPSNVRVYSIIGRGCLTNLEDGDGIATVESAGMKNAESFYVDGTCSGFFGESLHTALLDIDKYNETYRIVADILKK
ncbi:alpha/beta fold hydrolase [Candidatus Woesearchaeota archaeon]|nr:alpha/beta fold hydrolase [Candidatus Woesearchaeota archaeon]